MTDEARLQRWLDARRDIAGSARPRTFQSRDGIWSSFESLARELDVPVDELVNDAMAAYARVQGYGVGDPSRASEAQPRTHRERDPLAETHDAPAISALDRSYAPADARGFDDDDLARTEARGAFERPGRRPTSVASPESGTLPRRKMPLPAALERPVALPPSAVPPPARPSRPAPVSTRPPGPLGPPPAPRVAPPPARRLSEAPRESSSPVAKQLVLAYRGRQYRVDKDRFLLGRSKTQSDLRLDDPNVSRQHAAIERVGAAWYVVDLGSTNGVHVGGERVARRALADGDLIVITSHEIRCTLG